jgi:tRNA A-37 threonylcarbamoyl transferase component Bud32
MTAHDIAATITRERPLITAVEPVIAPDSTVTVLKRQGWAKADIKRLSLGGLQAILKDFSDKNRLARWIGRLQIRRETRALARLRGISGIPACLGEVAPCGLLLERVKGEPISEWRGERPEEFEAMFQRLKALVAAIHDRGVAHLDLRKRDNILIAAPGTPSIIDFNASVRFARGGLLARLLFPMFRAIDRAALLKWKAQLCPAAMTRDERRHHRRMTRLRRFWIFN